MTFHCECGHKLSGCSYPTCYIRERDVQKQKPAENRPEVKNLRTSITHWCGGTRIVVEFLLADDEMCTLDFSFSEHLSPGRQYEVLNALEQACKQLKGEPK